MEWPVLIAWGVMILIIVVCSYWDTARRIGRIERKLNLLLRHSGVDPLQGLPLSDRVKQLARDPAREIEAIKVYREETGMGLAQAREDVEAFINSQ